MKHVYLVQHSRERHEGCEEVKVIGIFRTEEAARLAELHLRLQPGFADCPSGFSVSKYELDKEHWVEGFAVG